MKLSRRKFLGVSLGAGATLAFGGGCREREVLAEIETEDLGPLSEMDVGGIIRPPGAQSERDFRAKCISCGVCVNVCSTMKYDSLTPAPLPQLAKLRQGQGLGELLAFGMPRVADLRDFPCALCMECPNHCPTGALQPLPKEDVKMGMALIDMSLCFGWNGDVCLSCSKVCPLGASVFDFYYDEWGNQPYINDRCVGCGLCVKYCPLGGSAIKVVTREQYSRVKADYLVDLERIRHLSREDRYKVVYGENLPKIMARGRLVEREYR